MALRKLMRWGAIFGLLAFFVLGVCWWQAPEVLAWAIVRSPNHGRATLADPPAEEWRRAGASAQLRVDVGPPPTSLSVWLFDPAAEPARGTVLVLHGIRGNKRSMRGIGSALAGQGYRAVLVDLPGHAYSTGDWLTYGAVESAQLSRLLDELLAQRRIEPPIGVYGTSYGAACAIQLSAHDPRVRAVVAIASFTSLREVFPCYVKRESLDWLLSPRQLEHALARAGELAHFDPDAASPREALTRTRAHVLLIHGTGDRNIPYAQAERNLEAAGPKAKLVPIPGATHDTITQDATGEVAAQTKAWFAEWLTPETQVTSAPAPAT